MYSIAISIAREGGMQGQQSSFFAMIYEELIPSDHLLRRLEAEVDLFRSPPNLSGAGASRSG